MCHPFLWWVRTFFLIPSFQIPLIWILCKSQSENWVLAHNKTASLPPIKPALGVPRRDIRRMISRWLVNQHCAWWRGLGDTQRRAWELISRPCLGAKLGFCPSTGLRAVMGLLTGHNTLRRHLHLLGLLDSPLCRRCGVKEVTSAHILCECEALASFRHQEYKSGGHLEL